MPELENENRETSVGEYLIAAFLVAVMVLDFFGWALDLIPTGRAVVVFLISLTLFFGLESLVLYYRKLNRIRSEILACATGLEKIFQFITNLVMLISGCLWLARFHPRESGWTCFIAAVLLAGQMLICQKFSK